MKDDLATSDSGTQALDRALGLFTLVLRDKGKTPLSDLAGQAGLPVSTAHRLIAAFERQRLITRVARGRYVAGMGLAELAADRRQVLINASRPLLRRLARQQKRTAHLGILEAEMVTYLVKEAGGPGKVFTREMMQLEAYCTGIGKVLLAGLDKPVRERYLAGGPFPRLTDTTLTEPDQLRAAIATIAERGFAEDDAEMAEGLHCVAVPLHDRQGRVVAAISLTGLAETGTPGVPPALLDTARAIEAKLWA
ncbi:MAG: IclR family transcriptional regulator [Zavarzinia sp.]|nr:IclR family transcriptional regulator [Zavarzinia sp.]